MNEASSKYVDQIATEKLLNEKLSQVHHAPDEYYDQVDASFADFASIRLLNGQVDETIQDRKVELTFPSWVQTPFPENDLVKCRRYCTKEPAGELIFLHGLYEDNLDIYSFFISLLNEQGYNVTLMQLPFHYQRRPASSLFSGEYFWSANIGRSALAYKQAVVDAYRLYRHIQAISAKSVCLVGFSMGGGIGLTLAALHPLEGLFVINPVCNISKLTWNSSLFSPIRQDLEANGIGFEALKKKYQLYEPLGANPVAIESRRVALCISLYDQINDLDNYELLASSWKISTIHRYKAGHLNILRVPRLAIDLAAFTGGVLAR